MILITTFGWILRRKLWIEFLRENRINKVIILRFREDYDPVYLDPIENIFETSKKLVEKTIITSDNQEGIMKAAKTLQEAVQILETLYIDYEYHELSKDEKKLTILAFLAKLITENEQEKFIIDFSRGERLFIPLYTYITSIFPSKFNSFISMDYRVRKEHEFPIIKTDIDPDRRGTRTTVKNILTLILKDLHENEFNKMSENLFVSSKEITERLNMGFDYDRPLNENYIKNRLQEMALVKNNHSNLLKVKSSTDNKRLLEYAISGYGLVIIYINYTIQKILNQTQSQWYLICEKKFEDIQFPLIKLIVKKDY